MTPAARSSSRPSHAATAGATAWRRSPSRPATSPATGRLGPRPSGRATTLRIAASPLTAAHAGTPAIATSLVAGNETGANISVALGTAVHDTATLTGVTATAGGTVHYQVFTNADCTTLFSDAGTVPVVNGVPVNSTTLTFNQSGIYYWQAAYSGDPANVPAP